MVILVIALLVALAIGSGVAIGAGIWAKSSTQAVTSGVDANDLRSELFVVDAYAGDATKLNAHSWRLDLFQSNALWFYDRPLRGSGSESPSALVAEWHNLFASGTPYGALVAPSGPKGHRPTAISLASPTYNATKHVLSFVITPDKGESVADTKWLSQLTNTDKKRNGRISLFVDNALILPFDGAPVNQEPMLCFGDDTSDCIPNVPGNRCPPGEFLYVGGNPVECVTSVPEGPS